MRSSWPAAAGQAGGYTNDYWNTYYAPWALSGSLSNLKWADGTNSGVLLTVTNAPGVWGNSTGDTMMDTYIYPWNGNNVTVTLHYLPAGQYDLYIYGAYGYTDETNGVYSLTSAGEDYGQRTTYLNSGWDDLNWTEGEHYVLYSDVTVVAGQPVVITAKPGDNVALINGLQLVACDELLTLGYTEISKAAMTADASSTTTYWYAANAINGSVSDPGWFTSTAPPAWLRLDLGTANVVGVVQYRPRVTVSYGAFEEFNIYVTDSSSTNSADWGDPVASGTWIWSGYAVTKTVYTTPKSGRYVIFECVSGLSDYASCNEVWVYKAITDGDSDGDGLPDVWETYYFQNQNQGWSGDLDGDGIINGLEYLQGRNPLKGSTNDASGTLNLRVFKPF